jgi:hypothetical protein
MPNELSYFHKVIQIETGHFMMTTIPVIEILGLIEATSNTKKITFITILEVG